MERERIIQVFFFAFLAVMAYELYVLLTPFLAALLWAILLAFVAHPLLTRLDRLMRHRTLSALIITLGVALGVILPAIWVSGRLASEAQSLYAQATVLVNNGGLARARDWMVHSSVIQAMNHRLAPRGIRVEDEVSRHAVDAARIVSEYAGHHVSGAARNIAAVLVDFGLILLTLFYLLRDGESYYNSLRDLTPLHEEDKKAIFETLRMTLSSVMRGLMLTALLQGVTIGIGLLIAGVPYWAFLALASAVTGLLPFGGTAIVWVPVALYLFYSSGWGWAIFLIAWCAISIAIIDNFIKPMVMRHGTRLPTLALFFGIAGGLEAYGPIGLFIGPTIMAVFAALLRVYRKTYGESRKEAA